MCLLLLCVCILVVEVQDQEAHVDVPVGTMKSFHITLGEKRVITISILQECALRIGTTPYHLKQMDSVVCRDVSNEFKVTIPRVKKNIGVSENALSLEFYQQNSPANWCENFMISAHFWCCCTEEVTTEEVTETVRYVRVGKRVCRVCPDLDEPKQTIRFEFRDNVRSDVERDLLFYY